MPKNRVDELESTVRELESTIQGLTEELVESKERIRVLEDMLEAEAPTRVPERRSEGSFEAEPDEVAAAAAEADSVDDLEIEPDAAEDASAGESTDADATDSDTDSEPQESRTDDIIVA